MTFHSRKRPGIAIYRKCPFVPETLILSWVRDFQKMSFCPRNRNFILVITISRKCHFVQKPKFYPGNHNFQKMSFCPETEIFSWNSDFQKMSFCPRTTNLLCQDMETQRPPSRVPILNHNWCSTWRYIYSELEC